MSNRLTNNEEVNVRKLPLPDSASGSFHLSHELGTNASLNPTSDKGLRLHVEVSPPHEGKTSPRELVRSPLAYVDVSLRPGFAMMQVSGRYGDVADSIHIDFGHDRPGPMDSGVATHET